MIIADTETLKRLVVAGGELITNINGRPMVLVRDYYGEVRAGDYKARSGWRGDALRETVLGLTRGVCFYCRVELTNGPLFDETTGVPIGGVWVVNPTRLQIDHKLPTERGGTNDLSNLAPACAPCNIRKGNRTVDEYRAYLEARGVHPNFFPETPLERDWLFVSDSLRTWRGRREINDGGGLS